MTEFITLGQLIDNEPFEVEIPGLGKALIRYPTKKETLDAEKEIRSEIGEDWFKLSETDRGVQIVRRLMLKILVKPKITLKDYLKCRDPDVDYLLDTIAGHYNKRIRTLLEKRREVLGDFLEAGTVRSP